MITLGSPKIDKTAITVASLFDGSDKKNYWLSKTPYEKLIAVEQLRQIIYGYNSPPPNFKDFLKLLKIHQVKYLLVGGYAVGYYGEGFRKREFGVRKEDGRIIY